MRHWSFTDLRLIKSFQWASTLPGKKKKKSTVLLEWLIGTSCSSRVLCDIGYLEFQLLSLSMNCSHSTPLNKQPLLHYQVVSWKEYITLAYRQMCMSVSLYCTIYTLRGRETSRAKCAFSPFCWSWHRANHLPHKAMAGTNLLKVICNHCAWKGPSHQWAFVRHFISKLIRIAMLEIFAVKIFKQQPSPTLIWFWWINTWKKGRFLTDSFQILPVLFDEIISHISIFLCLNGVMTFLYPFHRLSESLLKTASEQRAMGCFRLQIMR